MSWFCMAVRTGREEGFLSRIRPLFPDGRLFFFRKLMRTKKGKIYDEPFFPGYVFLESAVLPEPAGLRKAEGFLHFLPKEGRPEPLYGTDLACIQSLARYGETLGFAPCVFDENDRIVIVSGPFKDLPGTVVAVNRRNQRVNVRLEVFNRVMVTGLTYYDVRREDWSADASAFLQKHGAAAYSREKAETARG